MAQTRQDIEKRFSASFKGIENEACLASVLSLVHSDCFIFDKVIRITVKVPSIRIALSIGSLNGKTCLLEGYPRF